MAFHIHIQQFLVDYLFGIFLFLLWDTIRCAKRTYSDLFQISELYCLNFYIQAPVFLSKLISYNYATLKKLTQHCATDIFLQISQLKSVNFTNFRTRLNVVSTWSLKWLPKVTLIIYNLPKNEYIVIVVNTSRACH